MAITLTKVARTTFGNRVFTCYSALSTAGGETSITAKSVGLSRIDVAWTQSVDEATAELDISDWSGSSITFGALTNGDTTLFFFIGY